MPNPGSTTARGYDGNHKRIRREWAPIVEAGDAYCAATVCLNPDGTGRWIMPGQPWDLDHTDDRTDYRGPSHTACNRSAGAVRRNAAARVSSAATGERRALPTSENWWG